MFIYLIKNFSSIFLSTFHFALSNNFCFHKKIYINIIKYNLLNITIYKLNQYYYS